MAHADGAWVKDRMMDCIEDTLKMGQIVQAICKEAEEANGGKGRPLTIKEKKLIEEYNQRAVMLEYITGIRKAPREDSPRTKEVSNPVFQQIKK